MLVVSAATNASTNAPFNGNGRGRLASSSTANTGEINASGKASA